MKIKILLFSFTVFNSFSQVKTENIQIARDKWGVPHIFGKTDPEVAYGLAYAHAEDDFKTIQLTLLAGKGMLGQLKGKDGAAVDYVVALLHCREAVEEKYDSDLEQDTKDLIEGYVAGLNSYAKNFPQEVLVKNSFPINSKDFMTSATFSLSIISGVDGAIKNILKGNVKTLESFQSGGSNAFAFSGSKTTDGIPYLNINSHQPLEGPVAWYEAHLCSESGWNILGGLFPGSPLVSVGVNENLGWGHTVNKPDKIDVYQLKINPANKNQYMFDGKWIALEEKTVQLKVKMAGINIPIKKKAFWSKYGATLKTEKGTFSIRYAANQDIRGIEQWYKMDKAKNYTEFYKAMEMVAIPMFNTIYADRNDTIFYVSNAKLPIRNPKYDWKNTIPGDTSATLTTEFHPLKDLPQYINPKSGYLFNTNNTPFDATAKDENLKESDFDKTMGIETLDNNRSVRFQELMEKVDKLSYEEFKKIKYDNQLPQKLAFQADFTALFSIKPDDNLETKRILNSIQTWNKKSDIDSEGAAAFMTLLYYFIDKYKDIPNGYDRKINESEFIEGLIFTKNHFIKNFSKENPTLGEVQKLVRGIVEKPMRGMPDVLAAMYSRPYKNGKIKAYQGESYIELAKFPKVGLPIIESVINYGASNHEDSPHYADQVDMFLNNQTKKMTLDKAQVLKEAVKIYSPK